MTQREVLLEGGLPWGFRMHGGFDTKTPLKISRVNPGSKAAVRGVREGDFITTINGQSTKNLTNNEAHNLLKASGNTLKLGLNEDSEGSPKRRYIKTIRQESHQETIRKSSVTYSLQETFETLSNKQRNDINKRGINANDGDAIVVTNIPVSQSSTSSSSSTSTPNTLVAEGKTVSTDQAEVSRQSSYSNCSSIPDEGRKNGDETEAEDMNDGQERVSKSKRRRQRRKNLLQRQTSQENRAIVEIKEVTADINAIPEEVEEQQPPKSPEQEISTTNLEIIKLKRVEHKYKVESPKELRIEQIKRADKKLKVKSRSLDDDDLLNIQELSEASEAEDSKHPPDNVVISEASSEENLLNDADTQRAKRSTLSDITLKLNEDNVIESLSHISPEEEKQLRSFLGSLKLVDSPEESAKDLYERAESDSNTNTKKKQTRKELEQYFLPMAHNPRFLDAISEEASDMSDRESHSSKIDKNPKQGTPEQELKPPPVPPRKNKSKLLQKYASLPDKNDVFLVETKTVDPIGIQEDVCNTKTLKENAEKAEVVYINESSDSSISSSENTKENDDKDILQVRTNESLTTTISSHVTSTKNISKSNEFSTDLDAALLTELTPPPSPENNSHNGNTTEGSILKHILFDYTKVPNVLTEKEPDTGFKGLKRSTVETCKTETTKTESKSFNNQKEIKSLTSIHTNKETVNGEIKNIDVLKVSIDEKNDDGNIETRKSIEEYSGNPKNTDAATEKLDENVLKHMMMVSKDSNKTDNEKLLEFETICKINSELKQKIKKQESFGAMRSQSIDEKFTHKTSDNDQKEEEEEEYVPTKNLVQRRVKEFSGQVFNEQTVSVVSESENVDSNDLVKARVAKFLELDEKSNKVDLNHKTSKANNSLDNAKTNSNSDGSILKKILLPESREIDQLNPPDTNPTCIKNGLTESTVKLSEIIENEINTAIKVEESDSKELQGTSNVENNVPSTSSDSDSKPFIGTERYIPITTEESDKTDIHSKTENLTNINKSAENISVHKIENIESTTRSTSVKNASTPNTDLKMRNFGSISGHLKEMSKSVDNVMTNQKFEGLKSPIERTIPIKIEDSNAMKEFRNLSKSAENLSTHKTANNIERTIPITIEHLSSQIPRSLKLSEKYKSTDNMSTSTSINQLKQFSKSVENISKSTTHREINIPIKVEGSTTCNKNKERIIPIIIENSKEPQDCASKSRDRLGTTTNSIESVSQTEKVNEIKVTTDKEINIPIKVENTDDTKKIIHTTIIENSNSKITQDSASKARQHLETTTKSIDSASQTEAVNEIKTTSDTERIIPITIEHANSIQENSITNKSTNSLVEESSSKFVDELKTINTSVENITKDEMIGDIKYTIDREINIPDKVEESTNSTNNKEIIIPITIEKSNSNISVEDNTNSTITLSNENKMEASNSTLQNELKSITKSVENLAINQIVGETKAKENISFQHINVENTTNTKERIIPISVEDSNSKIKLSNSNSEKHKSADNTTDTSLPGRSNNKIETSNSKLLEKLKTISKSIENISKIHVVDEIKGTVPEEQNIPTNNKEKIIPISVEQCDAKVSVQFTNNTSNSTTLSSEKPDSEKKVTTPNTELLEQLKTITKSVENISKSQTTVNETKTAKCEETNAQIKLLNFIDSKERVIPISFGIADSESSNLYSQNTESKSDNIPVVSEDAKNDTISDNSSLLEKLKTIGKSMKNISKKDTSTEGVQNKDSNVKSSKVNEKIIPENSETIHTNVLSPPRRDSVSSDSSGESSRCTAKYNPNSSIGDITSITKEEENGGLKIVYEPMSLRSIVLNLMMSLPFGEEVLRELADVSKSIENYTNRLPYFFKSVHSQQEPKITQDNQVSAMPSTWYTDKDICVRQKGEGDRKFIEYDDRETTVMSPNRLLTIIREEPTETETSSEPSWSEDSSYRRLQARNLGEWLTLARNKSKSTSNLDCTNIPINTLRRNSNSSEPDRARLAKRRSSLPQELYERQLWSIMEKEREIQRELERLEDEKRKIQAEMAPSKQKQFHVQDFYVSKRGDYAEFREQEPKYRPVSMPVFPTEYFRQQMYNEYMDKFCEREERKQQKVIKISSSNDLEQNASSPSIKPKEIVHPIELEKEFMAKVKAKKLGRSRDNVTSDSELEKDEKKEPDEKTDEPPVIVLDGDKVKGVDALPKHLQDFVDGLADYQDDSASNKIIISPCDKKCCKEARRIYRVLARNRAKKQYSLLHEIDASLTIAKGFLFGKGIWSPGQHPPTPISKRTDTQQHQQQQRDDPISPVWTPKSANSSPIVERKEFRPVNFQSPVLTRRNRTQSESLVASDKVTSEPPWKIPEGSSDTAINLSSTLDRRLPNSQSSPGIGIYSTTPRLPRAQNPTITLLQKAREGHLPRGAQYIDQERKPPNDRPPIKYPGEVLYHIKNEYTSESDSEKPRKMADLAPRKFEGIGPTTKDGMPLILRSEVKDKDQSKWYKRMYDTIHKQKPHKDEFVTIKYRQKRENVERLLFESTYFLHFGLAVSPYPVPGSSLKPLTEVDPQYPYTSGYLSEPEPGAYDSDFTEYKYATLDRRRPPEAHHHQSSATMPRSHPDKSYSSSDIVRNTQETYRVQPGRIENYVPGHSSISESEAKKHLEQQNRVPPHKPRSFINQALKESGYESDSTLIFKRKEDNANRLNPREQREAYKVIQKGGDVPFQGLRKPAPERPKEPDIPPPPAMPQSLAGVQSQEQESPRKYVENEVTIHYKTPVRTEIKEYVSEDELAHRQAEAMKKIYEEEKRRKQIQELQDMRSRRHTDNFVPSQKSPIPLNRYDDFDDLTTAAKVQPRSPEPRIVAKALYNFVGHTARELTFRKGDLIYLRRQIDKNWYEGELNAMVGLFPVNYVEIVPYEGVKTTPRKAHEGQARAKYNFLAQTHLELSLAKGELVTITRKVDDNWFEGKIGGRKGIFPVSYVEVLIDPSDALPASTKPVASPAAHSLLLNGSSQGKESMGSHLYTPSLPNPIAEREIGFHHAKPIQLTGAGTYTTLPKSPKNPLDQALHIETQSEPIPYRALYKYTPQNDDELELLEGDTVYVLEKCDDGWYVGSSDRTGGFGTFPGNYVEKI
ncbi:cbl-associated protein isoform X5 [Rhynchophorus ferrugineus]|uniref:cbl-associated protein isoform X5 n=1 Tax=Rhynchophorus ferrugineus TaxID=354439 RepID=UPI003FCDE4C3